MEDANRGPWIIAATIFLAAALAIGAWAYFRDGGIQDGGVSCSEWQGEAGRVPLTPKIREARPEGCPLIDVPG